MAAFGRKYCNIHRLDRILSAEGDTLPEYQADRRPMLFYLFCLMIVELFSKMGYRMDQDIMSRTIDYYAEHYLPRLHA